MVTRTFDFEARQNEIENFMSFVFPEPNSGCWFWMGTVFDAGHSLRAVYYMRSLKRKMIGSRAAYELFVGPIPNGAFICHKCDIGFCVNPDHLYAGSHQDNMRDMKDRKRAFCHKDPDKAVRYGKIGGSMNNWSKGEASNHAKLTEYDVKNIRILRAGGISALTIAQMYSMNKTTIHRIINGTYWPHVELHPKSTAAEGNLIYRAMLQASQEGEE